MDTSLEAPQPTIHVAGANRGARAALIPMAGAVAGVPVHYYDYKQVRAAAMAVEAAGIGLLADGLEADARHVQLATGSLLISHVDGPASTRDLALAHREAAFLAYLYGRTSDDRLFTLGISLPGGGSRRDVALFLSELAAATQPGGSEYLFGRKSRPAIRHAEYKFRRLVGSDIALSVAARIGGEPAAALWFSLTGEAASPLTIVDSRTAWANPAALAWHAVTTQRTRPGDDLAVAEIGPGAIRVHAVRRRLRDRAVVVNGIPAIDPRGLTPLAGPAYDHAQREADALSGTAAAVISGHDPIYMSD